MAVDCRAVSAVSENEMFKFERNENLDVLDVL